MSVTKLATSDFCDSCGRVKFTKAVGFDKQGEPLIQALHEVDCGWLYPAEYVETNILLSEEEICTCTKCDRDRTQYHIEKFHSDPSSFLQWWWQGGIVVFLITSLVYAIALGVISYW